MAYKIFLTGALFACLLLIPMFAGATSGHWSPPQWVKASIIVPGTLGLVLIFISILVKIWEA